MPWFVVLLIVLAVETIAYAVMPKPAKPRLPAVQDEEYPTADADRPIPVVFGEISITGTNVLWYGETSTYTYMVNT